MYIKDGSHHNWKRLHARKATAKLSQSIEITNIINITIYGPVNGNTSTILLVKKRQVDKNANI